MSYATSPAGLALIQEFEGFRSDPAQLPDGNWVVGYNHIRVGEGGESVTEAEAASLLALDIAPIEAAINAHVIVDLTQSQFDALACFTMSVGVDAFLKSQVLRRVNAGAFVAAASAFDAWRKSDVGGELIVVDALVRRRAAERALFLKDLPHGAAPSAFMRAQLDYAALVLGAPVNYAPVPAVRPLPVVQAKPAPAQRLTEILKSEPATEALLLTQVAPDEQFEDEDEIVTAHAKPVARSVEAFRAAKPDRRISRMRRRVEFFNRLTRFGFGRTFETAGIVALFLFGVGLTLAGGSTFYTSNGDVVQLAGATALAAPGLAAMLLAGVARVRESQPNAIRA